MSIIDKIKLNGTTYDVGKIPDTTLTHSGQAADAKAAGDEISDLKSALDQRLPMTNDGRTLLQSGDDLNNCTVGVYVCQTIAVAETLINCPVKVGFRLNVFYNSSGQYLTQILITNGGNVWLRSKGESTFYAWKKVARIDELKEYYFRTRYNGRKISIIGDSIDTYDETGYKIDGYRMYYPALGVSNVLQTWWMQVINASGMELEVNASWSGSRVTNTAPDTTYPDFYDRVTLIGNPDVIFVTLGTNDSNYGVTVGEYDFDTSFEDLSESEFRPAYIKGVKALQDLYPDAEIVCIAQKMEYKYKKSIEHIADTLGVKFVDASDYIGQSGVHPGILGMRQIAANVLYPTDKTLLFENVPADSKATGDIIHKLSKSLGGETVIHPAMERGGINSETGEKTSDTKRIRTQDFISTDDVASIVAPSGGLIAVSYYDSAYTLLKATSFLDFIDDFPTGLYMKIVVRKSDNTTMYADESYSPTITVINDIIAGGVKRIDEDIKKLIKTICPPTNMKQGSISGTGEEQSSSTRIRSIAYIPTHNLKSVKVGEGYQYTVISYDHNLAFVATTGWITEERTAFYSDYIRLVIARSDGENITPAEDTGLVLERMESAPQVSINMLKDAYSPDQMTSGCTFVGNDLWCFIAAADDGSNYGDVYILSYDITTNTLTHLRTIQHNLGHVNSVSYCEETDTLICGNGSNVYNLSGKIFILQGAASKTRLERSDCIEIDVGFNFGFKVNCVWGDKNVNRHDIAYICSNDSHSIYRIQLGQGTHDLGSGVLVEGATGFNGTYKVLNSWSWGFVGRDYDNVIQGMVFWKNRLIWGYGHNNGFSVRLAKLYEGGRIEVETANYKTTDADGEVLERYMAGMVKFGDNEEYLGICASRHLLVIKDWN